MMGTTPFENLLEAIQASHRRSLASSNDGNPSAINDTGSRRVASTSRLAVSIVIFCVCTVEGLQVTTKKRARPCVVPLNFAPTFHADGSRLGDSASISPLFRAQQPTRNIRPWFCSSWPSSRRQPSTARDMVLTTPESIIEQASTQSLLDDLLDESVRISARKPIMMQFDPSSGYIWRRWQGTVFSETWASCVRNMAISVITLVIVNALPGVRKQIDGFNVLWSQLLGVTTFTLTFFLNQSYALWRKCYELSRRLQGRLNDLGMTLAAHAARTNPANMGEMSTYTSESRQLLELIGRYIRLFNLLTYASFTRSHRPVLTPRGMRRLVERNLLTPNERHALIDADIPATQRHNAVVLWIIRAFDEGRRNGLFVGGDGFEQQFLEKCHVIRAQYGAIADELQGRMPLAYAHIVQVLVDVILWLYPVMSFSVKMSPLLGVLGTGLLTMSYQGLFELAKRFLDPYDNETYGRGEDPLNIDTLIAETNSGSVRWLNSFEYMPFSSERIQNGEMATYILPLKGSSVEELAKLEEEKIKREQEEVEGDERKEEMTPTEAVVNSTILFSNETGVNGLFARAKSKPDTNVSVVLNETVTASRGNHTDATHDPEPAAPLTLEEFSEKVQELKRAAEDELKETVAILSAPPGASSVEDIDQEETKPDQPVEEVTSQHEEEKEDDTDKLEKIDEKLEVAAGEEIVAELEAAKEAIEEDAALVEELLVKKKEHEKNDAAAAKETMIPDESTESDVHGDFIGLAAKRDSAVGTEDFVSSPNSMGDKIVNGSNVTNVEAVVILDDGVKDTESSVSLSEKDEVAPLTLEEYSEKVQSMKEAAEQELKETMAILNAPPGSYLEPEEDEHAAENSDDSEPEDDRDDPVSERHAEKEEKLEKHLEKKKQDVIHDSSTIGDKLVAELEAAKGAYEEDAAAVEEMLERKKNAELKKKEQELEMEKELEEDIELLMGGGKGPNQTDAKEK